MPSATVIAERHGFGSPTQRSVQRRGVVELQGHALLEPSKYAVSSEIDESVGSYATHTTGPHGPRRAHLVLLTTGIGDGARSATSRRDTHAGDRRAGRPAETRRGRSVRAYQRRRRAWFSVRIDPQIDGRHSLPSVAGPRTMGRGEWSAAKRNTLEVSVNLA